MLFLNIYENNFFKKRRFLLCEEKISKKIDFNHTHWMIWKQKKFNQLYHPRFFIFMSTAFITMNERQRQKGERREKKKKVRKEKGICQHGKRILFLRDVNIMPTSSISMHTKENPLNYWWHKAKEERSFLSNINTINIRE